MNYIYNKSSFNDKLDKIIEARYKTKKANTWNKQYRAFYSDYRKKYFSDDFDISASVRIWRSHSSNQLPKIEILIKLCSLLDCDIDYFITEQTDFRKDLAAAAETTGLQYETIEVLEKIKNSKIPDNGNHMHKCILFVLDFLLQRITGRWILWNIFQYLFKKYSYIKESDDSGSNVVELEADSIVPERNVALFVDDISEGVFFSNITNGIAKIKIIEKTFDFDTSACDYLPAKEDIINEIRNIESDISLYKEKEYKKYNPYTPKYALEYQHWEDTGEWEPRDNLAKEVESRVRLDIIRENQIEKLESVKENCILKLQKLYPEA